MNAFTLQGKRLRCLPFHRERRIYRLFSKIPALLDRSAQFRLLALNVGPEKGPDFLGLNDRGHLVIGEIKKGTMGRGGLIQARCYAKLFLTMRQRDLDGIVAGGGCYPSIRAATKNFLSRTAQSALRNPSRRRIQIVLVAERFSDTFLRDATRDRLGRTLRRAVKDIKAVAVQLLRVAPSREIVVAEVVGGRRRRLGR